MSVRTRALIIGLAGPAMQAVAIAWVLIHLLVSHLDKPLTPRHIIFETPFLLLFVGVLVTIVCIPVALEVTHASREDVAIPAFGPGHDRQAELQAETAQ